MSDELEQLRATVRRLEERNAELYRRLQREDRFGRWAFREYLTARATLRVIALAARRHSWLAQVIREIFA